MASLLPFYLYFCLHRPLVEHRGVVSVSEKNRSEVPLSKLWVEDLCFNLGVSFHIYRSTVHHFVVQSY